MHEYTQSVGEVRAGLTEVAERLHAAYRCARTAEQRLAEAVALLTELDRSHHDQLVPPQLLSADPELSRGLDLIMGGAESVTAIEARL
ncbi:MAG: hypothetical protein ACR2G2_17325 [Pseudonocardia sp.]